MQRGWALHWSGFLLLFLLASSSVAADPPTPGSEEFALVLGGGGALGLAHVGVLAELEARGLRPSLIVGTSMGAIIGGLSAAGIPADRLEELISEQAWQELLLDRRLDARPLPGEARWDTPHQVSLRLNHWPPMPPAGLSRGQDVVELVGRETASALLAADNDFDRLPIRFRCVSTDLLDGTMVVHDRGPISRAVRASGSLPFIFTPVQWEGRLLVDGGFADNMPVEIARALGFQRILMVDVRGIFLTPRGEPRDLLSVLERSYELGQMPQNMVEPREGETLIEIDLRDHGPFGYWDAKAIVERGREAMRRPAEELALTLKTSPRPVHHPERGVELVEVETVAGALNHPDRLARVHGLVEGETLTPREIWARVGNLVDAGSAQEAWVELIPVGEGQAKLRLHAIPREVPELQFGAHLDGAEGLSVFGRLRANNLTDRDDRNELSVRVGDWRQEAQARLDLPFPWRIRGSLGALAFEERFPSDPQAARLARGSAALGISGRRGWGHLEIRAHVGALESEARDGHLFGWSATLSSRPLAIGTRSGASGAWIRWAQEQPGWGSDFDSWRAEAGFLARPSWRRQWRMELAGAAQIGRPTRPSTFWGEAGGSRGAVVWKAGEAHAPQVLWGRAGLDYLISPELSVGYFFGRGALGTERKSLRYGSGHLLRTELLTPLGPVQLGLQWPQSEKVQFIFGLGFPF